MLLVLLVVLVVLAIGGGIVISKFLFLILIAASDRRVPQGWAQISVLNVCFSMQATEVRNGCQS